MAPFGALPLPCLRPTQALLTHWADPATPAGRWSLSGREKAVEGGTVAGVLREQPRPP